MFTTNRGIAKMGNPFGSGPEARQALAQEQAEDARDDTARQERIEQDDPKSYLHEHWRDMADRAYDAYKDSKFDDWMEKVK
jgi:hypothetical protein